MISWFLPQPSFLIVLPFGILGPVLLPFNVNLLTFTNLSGYSSPQKSIQPSFLSFLPPRSFPRFSLFLHLFSFLRFSQPSGCSPPKLRLFSVLRKTWGNSLLTKKNRPPFRVFLRNRPGNQNCSTIECLVLSKPSSRSGRNLKVPCFSCFSVPSVPCSSISKMLLIPWEAGEIVESLPTPLHENC